MESDVVVILSWSIWTKESISNRRHYATRFNNIKPVIFVELPQGQQTEIRDLNLSDSGYDFTLVTPAMHLTQNEIIEWLSWYLQKSGFNQGFFWIYNAHYLNLMSALPASLICYHATEDYFDVDQFPESLEIRNSLIDYSHVVDLWIFCSTGVMESYSRYLKLQDYIYLPNGVDYKFYSNFSIDDIPRSKNVVYQGNINNRLDFRLIYKVVSSMEEIIFLFIGPLMTNSKIWKKIRALPNVYWFETNDLEKLREIMHLSAIAWIPFKDSEYMRTSAFPLKYFEYKACGLSVVCNPMYAISRHDPNYIFAQSPREFIESLSHQLIHVDSLKRSINSEIASIMDYDKRFDELLEFPLAKEKLPENRLVGLLIIDPSWLKIPSVRESIAQITQFRKIDFVVIDNNLNKPHLLDDNLFDLLIIHHSVRFNQLLNPIFLVNLKNFSKTKYLLIQDDYDNPLLAIQQITEAGIDVILTTTPHHLLEIVYPKITISSIKVVSILTAYTNKMDSLARRFWIPLKQRKNLIVYRGRNLPRRYGFLGRQKTLLASQFQHLLEHRNEISDISTSREDRIYDTWEAFLASGISTLVTESGSSIIDWDGTLAINDAISTSNSTANQSIEYEELEEPWNVLSPRVFEAIRQGTILVGLEGWYSGILKPHVHYLPVKSDYSNIEEILVSLMKPDELEIIRNNAYDDILLSRKYDFSYLENLVLEEIRTNNQNGNKKFIQRRFRSKNVFNLSIFHNSNQIFSSNCIVSPRSAPHFFSPTKKSFIQIPLNLVKFVSWREFRFRVFRVIVKNKFGRKLLLVLAPVFPKISKYKSLLRNI